MVVANQVYSTSCSILPGHEKPVEVSSRRRELWLLGSH